MGSGEIESVHPPPNTPINNEQCQQEESKAYNNALNLPIHYFRIGNK